MAESNAPRSTSAPVVDPTAMASSFTTTPDPYKPAPFDARKVARRCIAQAIHNALEPGIQRGLPPRPAHYAAADEVLERLEVDGFQVLPAPKPTA